MEAQIFASRMVDVEMMDGTVEVIRSKSSQSMSHFAAWLCLGGRDGKIDHWGTLKLNGNETLCWGNLLSDYLYICIQYTCIYIYIYIHTSFIYN